MFIENTNDMAKIAIDRSLLKEYKTHEDSRVVYMNDGDEFQIQLFNPEQFTIGAEIYINGKKIYKQKSLEVDFIATKGNQKYYIQSCLNMNDEETLKREKRSLHAIDDSFEKIIVTKNGLDTFIDENGYRIIDIFDFLLNPPF